MLFRADIVVWSVDYRLGDVWRCQNESSKPQNLTRGQLLTSWYYVRSEEYKSCPIRKQMTPCLCLFTLVHLTATYSDFAPPKCTGESPKNIKQFCVTSGIIVWKWSALGAVRWSNRPEYSDEITETSRGLLAGWAFLLTVADEMHNGRILWNRIIVGHDCRRL